ncbi:MAG: hypothetical protein WBC19_11760 [Pyrinomonadaceae bacterium]
MKKYPAILHNGNTLEWLGEVPPESLTGKPYDAFIHIDMDQFKKTDLIDKDSPQATDTEHGDQTADK